MKKWILLFLTLLSAIVVFLFFQNCGTGWESGDFMSSSCTEDERNTSYDACVVNKNSVYEKDETSSLTGPDYSGMSLQAVQLPFLDNSGSLQDDTFRVIPYTGEPVSTVNKPLRFDYEFDEGVALAQVTSYYYASLARQFAKNTSLSLTGQGVYIITQAPLTGWSSIDNTIYLGINPSTQHNSGLDGSIILNLVSEANIYYATQGSVYTEIEENHKHCREKEYMCCSHQEGCSKAITMGLSHYFSSSFFMDAPTVGESYSNRITGMEDCGVSRDLNESKDLLLSQAFYACKEEGYVYPMATFFASIWWNVFQKTRELYPNEVEKFKTFYLEYVRGIHGSMNFIDAFHLIETMSIEDPSLNVFVSDFKKELNLRGLDLQ